MLGKKKQPKLTKKQQEEVGGVLGSKKLSNRIKDEMKFTGLLINDIRQEIDRMTAQNKLLYDESQKTNNKLESIERKIDKLTK